MHTAYIRPGGVAYDASRFIKWDYEFLTHSQTNLMNGRIINR